MNNYTFLTVMFVALVAFSGCDDSTTEVSVKPQPIDVATVLYEPVQNWHTFTTRLEAPQEVALTPRVSGVIENVAFQEGDLVKAGEVLFTLDPRPFVIEVINLDAQINSAQAALEQAENENSRAVALLNSKAISTEEVQARTSTLRQRQAQLKALEAQRQSAKLSLEFSSVVAPIDGVVSKANITKGNHVTAGQTVLTSIVSNQAMYAYFNVDERTWNQDFSDDAVQRRQKVMLQRLTEQDFNFSGYINFVDNKINPATGTLQVRAVFEQGANSLKAGGFSRIKVAASQVSELVIVPEKAIGTDLQNRFVLTLNADNILEYKPVELGERYGHLRAITKGLSPSDVIAVNGPARVGANTKVTPSKVSIDTKTVAFTLPDEQPTLMVKR